MLYLDYAATTRPAETVIDAMIAVMRDFPGNPSSLHAEGREAKKRYNRAKTHVAELLGANRENILFTSSGTEAINFVIKGVHNRHPEKTLLVSTIEHAATKRSAEYLEERGASIRWIGCDHEGYLRLDELERALRENDVALLSLIYANNEIGTIQDARRIADMCHAHGAKLHLDMVQAPLHSRIDMKALACDYASFSAHKFFGPRGVGFLYAKTKTDLDPLIHGGKQEDNLRAGTENLPGIVGTEVALAEAARHVDEREERIGDLADHLLTTLKESGIAWRLNGPPLDKPRLKNIVNIGLKDLDAADVTFRLDKEGIGISEGSACSSETIEESHVLKAIGVDDDHIEGSVRISFSHEQTKEDMERLVHALERIGGNA